MTLALIHSRALLGLQAPAVTVEVHLVNGRPSFNLVGLVDTEVKETRAFPTPRPRAATAPSPRHLHAQRLRALGVTTTWPRP